MSKGSVIGKRWHLLEYIFFGNFFYGICAVALSIEASLQQRIPINSFLYYTLIFAASVLYYMYPYVKRGEANTKNPRTNWYRKYYVLMRWSQVILTIVFALSLALIVIKYWDNLLRTSALNWALILLFPVIAGFYYGAGFLKAEYNLRKIGSLKPFIIGFTWAGLVTDYPVLFYDITHDLNYNFNWTSFWLFGKNFMFISVLCILFDIKDYRYDYISQIKTFIVKMGLRKTIFYVLLLSLIGLVSFIFYAIGHQFQYEKVLLNTIPFILLLLVAWSLRRRKSLMYYLIVVDGLMLVKAICGSIAMIYF